MSDSQDLSIPTDQNMPQPAVWMARLGSLLEDLGDGTTAPTVRSPVLSPQTDNPLVQVRLGIAASLYVALRAKHAATASHSLRVAMTGSAWALAMDLPAPQRDALEVAALLHDVGVMGLPDKILLKPGPLDNDELRIVQDSRRNLGLEILRTACAEPAILQIVENVGAWYDGFRGGFPFRGTQIPLGARMISIVEAYDAMTSDQVFRAAVSQERAMAELFQSAGSQFDPELVRGFAELTACDQSELRREIAQRWLQRLDPQVANSYWQWNPPPAAIPAGQGESLFQMRLLDNMHDAVIFVDAHKRVLHWNHGAERLTGIAASTMWQRPWSPELLNLHNEKGEPIGEEDCPVQGAIRSGVQSLRRLSICGRNGRSISVDTHTLAVVGDDGTTFGAVLLLHDASSEISLEERCQSLHEKATKDPMTQVANRAELDCVHEAFIRHHRQHRLPCSLIICDLDKFKLVNDTYGHQAGDEAIKSLATLLKNSCRPGDLVARYGGEEFVMLCADCDNAAVARRAEQIRKALSQICQPRLEGRSITASFGATEIQPGDTAETMLRRADRALLMAKAKGRNTVVQLGSGTDDLPERNSPPSGLPEGPLFFVEQRMSTPVPIQLAVEKLRGFVADHSARIESIDGGNIKLLIEHAGPPLRRHSDRTMAFLAEIRLEEERSDAAHPMAASRTRIYVKVTPQKQRDRRREDVGQRAREILASFRCYLMATCESGTSTVQSAPPPRTFFPWLFRRQRP
jgi:diguanylate cyclase (GGDEF)-like protein